MKQGFSHLEIQCSSRQLAKCPEAGHTLGRDPLTHCIPEYPDCEESNSTAMDDWHPDTEIKSLQTYNKKFKKRTDENFYVKHLIIESVMNQLIYKSILPFTRD
jgi:hypothetical protein